ncbi:MAG: hypothetical protein K9H48_15790 [Melioribacteraceae bacterium]|nr:hypothetical protein [Saprospiraceae bacterium]MCF8355915.1 hypothetical protein [Melioribacteraceae bacterium]MCF8395455.1 hypothetical protein [Melioribacteraceae bacterium]
MKKIFVQFTIIIIAGFIISLAGCKNSTEPEESVSADSTGGSVVRKPNIYLYPTNICSITVKLEFPLGGRIIESEPYYNNGWAVTVNTTGKINDEYDYLYYEAVCPEVYQYHSGWIVSKDSLSEFFSHNLSITGFNETEKKDFIEYWIPRFSDYEYYIIYPQYSHVIDKIIRLNFSIIPDNILRLFYVIKGTDNNQNELSTPIIPSFSRNGFVVTEWGVIIK